ncbi:MAG: GLUG motif-containing protein [Christensenellales bacterium]
MRNSRTKTQTKLRNYIKLTAGALLLAITFVLVFAGTLSGAFGIENELQQNGIIQSNVASAKGSAGSTLIDISSKFSATNTNSFNINPDVAKRGKLWTTDAEICENNTWTMGDGSTGGTWTIADKNRHSGNDYGCVWFDFNVGDWYGTLSDEITISVTGVFDTPQNEGAVVGIDSSSSEFGTPTDAKKLYENIRDKKGESGNGKNDSTGQITGHDTVGVSHILKGQYVRVYYMAWDNGYVGAINFYACTLSNVKVSIERTLKSYTVEYNKNADSSTGTVDSTSHKYMAASNITSDFYVGNGQYFTGWNTSANGSGIAMAIGASTGTSTAASDFGNVVKTNLQNGQTTTTLYAQYQGISFTFNGKDYTQYNNEVLQVLQGRGGYLTHTVDSSYSTVVSYRNSNGSEIAQPITIGVYSAIIEVSKDGKTRGTVTLPFEIIEGDFGKIQGGTGKWGSVTNPYVISNETHLKNLSAIVNGRDALNSIVGSDGVTAEQVVATDKTYKDCYFVVAANLGAGTAIELVPIGKDGTHYFAGTIFGGNDSDANNRTMRTINLNIQQSGVSNVGLFGYVKGASISHLTTAGTIVGGAAVGGLVGYADGVTISNCRNNATVTGAYMIGGLVGFGNDVTITSSANEGNITSEENAAGTPSGLSKGAYVGGFVGVANGGSIANCYNNGNISASGANSDFLGGIAGYTTAPISYCASLKDKTIEGSNQVGGIVGKASGNNAKIEYCYFGGKINGLWNDNRAKLDFICAEKEDGSSVSNSWKLSSAIQGATGNRQYTNAGHSIQASAFSLSPSYFDGTEYTPYTEVDGWQNILTVNINAFQILGETESGKFLALHDGSNNSTLPNKTVIGKEKNSTGSPAKTDLVVNFIVYYNADTKQDVVAELKDIKIDAAAVDYNATEQYVVDNTQLPTTVNTHYFKQSFYFDQNGGGNATLGKTNAGTYKVYSDVWIRANNTDYLVGRKESTWAIKKLRFTIDNNQFFYGQDIENAIKNQIVIKNQSNVSVPKGAYTVVFGFNDTEHNFYGSIDIDQNQKEFSVAKTIISIYDSSNTLINDNFDINGFSVIVKAGDFGVQNNGINKSNIENNPWGSESNPYIIGTRGQLVTLSNIVRGVTNATNSQYTSDVYKYVKGTIASYGGAYFKLARSIASIGNITPIGTISNVFAATFDGNNNNLSGLNISVAGNNVGLFGYISGATIKNLTVNGSVKGSQYVGGVVGYALNSTIENVTNNASVSTHQSQAAFNVSYTIKQKDGTEGNSNEGWDKINDNNDSTKYCASNSKTSLSFIIDLGSPITAWGFAIFNGGDTNTYPDRRPNEIYIWGSNSNSNAAFPSDSVGKNNSGNTPSGKGLSDYWTSVYSQSGVIGTSVTTRYEIGFPSIQSYRYYWVYLKSYGQQIQFAEFDILHAGDSIGGVVGYSNGTNIKNATNNENIVGGNYSGGIVGQISASSTQYTITDSKNIGSISGNDGTAGIVGGIASGGYVKISACENSGNISGGENSNGVAGIIGHTKSGGANRLVVDGCKNTGTISGGRNVGGIGGRIETTRNNKDSIVFTNCYNDKNITAAKYGTVGGIVGYLYANGTTTVDVATISYCFSSGIMSTNATASSNVGGIVGNPNANSSKTSTRIFNCYTTNTTQGISGTSNATVDATNYVITSGTTAPTINNGGSYLLYDSFSSKPVVINNGTFTPFDSWADITKNDFNGFSVSGSVGKNQFFCSDNGSDTNTKYVKPSKTEGFAGDNGDVTAWYSATIESNIRVRVQNITLPTIGSKEYDGLAHGFGHTTYPNTANGAAANNPIVYTTEFLYVGTTYKENLNVSPTNVDVYNTTVTIKIDGQIVGVKKGDTVTITERLLKVSNVWTSASEHVAGDTSNVYIFHYNTQHQGIIENGISVASVHGEFAIPQDVYTIGGYVETKQAHNDTTHTRTFTLNDIRNYKIENKYSQYDDFSPNTVLTEDTSDRGISEATVGDTIVVTYTWKIVPYSLATNITSGNVWFGGRTDLIVGNQGIANVNVGNQSYADKRFYPLQSAQTGVQKVLVYAQHNYAADKFVLYVKYNNGTVAVLTQGTEYTLSALDAPTVENPTPLNTSVTASGKGNFDGDITKYYTAMFSDFGWKDGKTPEDNDWGGSADNPYVISKPEHLLRLSQIVNGGTAWNSIQNTVTAGVCIAPQTTAKATSRDYKDAYFLVTVDIDMSGYISTDGVYNFLPIGTRSTQNQTELPFSATFDGGDNTITYVYNVGSFYNVDGARKNYVGLFGYLNGATISNLKVASNGGLSITDNSGIVGIEYVGGIAGYAVDSTLYNSVLAYGGWVRGETYVGSIVGYGERITIVSSEAVSSANVGGETYVGGIVGKWIVSNQSQIGGSVAGQRYVTPADQIDVMGIKYVGGIAGWMDTSSCATTISYAPQLNNNGKDGNFIVVGGIEYVGALFGAFIGNGYHQNATNDKYTAIVIDKDASDKFKVGNVKVILQKLNEQSASGNAKVVGGLVGYAEGVGILFNTDWTTSNVTLDTGNYTPSFIGGIAGVLGKNATIEAIYQLKNDGTFLTGGTHTITHSVPDEQKTFGTAAKPLGSFVGGIVGYVSSQAGVYWETGTTIFGNGISLVNLATIYATSYAGGIFGALGDLSTSVAKDFENDTNSILYNVLTTGVRSGNASTTLGLAPTVSGNGITAQGRLVNNASISVSGSYVGGIAGYGGAKVRFVLRNTPQDSAIDVSKLNIYSGGSDIFINGSYAGGIAGYLVDNLEHDLQYIVVKARFNTNNQSATRVGGLVGYMGSGNVQNCVVTNGGSSAITASTDTYQGSEYVGGLVGETQNATIRNSVSTGFNLEKTSNTKGGLLGYGANPTIDSSWTFYIAKKRTNFAKNATPNGAYYATVSQSPYGKYILVDEGLINATESSYPTFASLCGFVGLLTNANVEGTLEFAVKVPNKTLNSNYENTQLAFYNASGSDTVTDNVDSFSKFENNNNTLTIALDMASGNSMQICVVGIEFVNVPQKNDTDTDKTTVVEGKYRKPSNSDKYIVHVTTANFNSERQITKIVATVYFECNGNLPVVIGSAYDDKRNIGGYDETFTPGSSTNPYTISSQEEWNDFAYSVYSGAKDYAGEYVKLLTNITINNTTAHMGTASSSTPLNFSTECTPNNNSDDNKNAKSNLGYNLAGNISQGSSAVNRIYFGTSTTLSTTTPSFKGTFDGNGNTIDIQYTSGGYHRISVFPNAANATFKNLTINGTIAAGTNTSNSGYDIAAFVGKPFGAITFTNCTAAVDIQGLRVIAGFFGYSSSTSPITLIGCVNKGDITSFEGSKWNKSTGQNLGYPDDYQYGTGGLIAYATNDITIDSCLNTGNVVGQTKVGGLVGRVTAFTTIKNSANTGDITGEEVNPYISNDDKKQAGNAWSRVGGLVGEASKTATLKMYACYNTGAIRGKSNVAGGLVGILGTIPSNEKPHSTEANNTSTIAYCYNTGEVTIGWKKFGGITMVGLSGYNFNGTDAGGLVGVAVKLNIEYSYNTGDIHGYGGVGNLFTWQVRNGGILAEACTKASNCSISINNCYSTGRIYIEENETNSDTRYSADIVGYLDEDGGDNNDGNSKVRVANCYGIANNIVSRKDSAVVYYSGWNSRSGNVKYVRTGTTLNSLSDLTAIMRSDGSVKPRAFYYANNQNNEVELWNASTATIKDGAQNTTAYKNGTLGGYVYVYGCLPQLAVFAVDTYNGLSMNSQNYGQDIYGEYREQKAGEEYSPYVIRDGIDLMGVQTLVGLGYTFEDKYIEFANGSNNITLDKNLSSDVAKAINMPISNSTSTKIADSENAYKSLGKDNTYHIGKSYHLFKLSAVCYDDNNIAQNTAYGYWLSSNHYYNGAYGIKEGAYKNYGTFKTQNILTIGRNGNVFKGSISGKQENNANTIINNLRITSGQTIGGAYGGLFGHVENAYIGYIEVGGESNIWAYSSDNQQIAATGAIAGYVTGDSIIEHCAVSGTTAIGAYGKNDDTPITSDITFAGGIVGLVDTKQGNTYNTGISITIKDCYVNISTTTDDRKEFAGMIVATKSNIGGVLGYVEGSDIASGKSNTVRIEGCSVDKAVIQAASSANTSSQIGGILGYGSEFVAAFITGCKVGVGGAVSIKGEHSLGGIAGGMSNAKGGYIDSCTVGANTTIERVDVGGDKTVLESENHGTAIGGLVGFTQDSKDDTSPLTTTFSGTSAFNGTITVSVEATNPSTDSDGKISCIGGIVGDMGSGANFASGSNVTVGGNINITLAAANVGGVVGRTNKATFIGKFNVAPNMSTENAENVGGFIGKNIGTVYILADTTDKLENTTVGALNGTSISIGGKIKGTSEVGGFIGVNNSGSTLNIGSNVANAKPYKSGKLEITITASVTGSGDNVGGIVGKNEGVSGQDGYAIVDIVKGTIKQNGAIKGANNVGGIIGLNDGLLTTGGGEADTTIGGVTLSEEQQNKIKNLSINNTGSVTGTGDYVGGVVGKLDSPSALRTEDSGKGAIAGTFTNSGNVSGGKFVGGSLGYVGKNVTITAKNNVATLFVNDGQVTATGYYAGGSIGVLVGKIEGVDNGHTVNFKNTGTVTATGFVGGSIGVLAGPVKYAQFVNSSGNLSIAAVNAVGGSVGFIGVPTPLETILTGVGITLADDYVKVENTHFEASGELTANPDSNAISVAKDAATNKSTGWGGVGGAIGVIGKNVRWGTEQNKNTYYANGNVTANGINNVGGIVGIILAENVNISNMLAYNTTVKGGENVGGIVGATDGIGTVITSAYAIEGTFTGSKNVGGIIGLAKTDTDASTSYWVKGYANSDIATYDVKDLSKLGFTTGKAETGWFFLYANDANGANGLGTINTSHSTNSDLQYWKRIADAYTASEREKGLDKTDLKSNIVYGGGSPQLSTLYATATAAEVNSQYYMYTATSNEAVKPQVEFDDTRNGYFISVKTNDQDAAGNKRQAQNVAVFYRKITKGSDLTYNGYARNAVVGMDGVGLLEQTPDETTVYDETYRNKYFYTTSTSVDGTTATTAMSDPNTYKSTIKIYFFDGKGKARIVGGIDDLEWTIKARELSATFKVATNRKYGEDSNGSEGENKYDMFVSISNIAPNRGKQVPIKLDVSVGNDIVVTFTWNGSAFTPSKAGSGITLLSSGMKPSEAMKDSDTMFIAEEQTDGLNTQVLNCYLVFTEAKAYTVTINTSDVVAKPRYTIKDGEATGSFTVDPKELTLERTSGGSHAFDNTSAHGAVWKITGFVYEDGFKQLAQFNPVFHSNGQTENMYDSGGLKNNINFTNGSVVQATQTDGVNKTITITLSTVRTLGDYYIEFNAGKVGENKYRVGNYELSFVKGQNEYHIVKTTIKITSSTEKGGAYTSKVYNQKTASITVTFTASADGDPKFNGIMNFEDFLTRFFGVKDISKFSKVDIPTSSSDIKKTVSWTFTTKADAGNYVVALIEGKDHVAEEANCAHDPDKLPSYTYTIKQRPVTISVTQTGSGSYTYNTKHQGLDTVSVNQGSQGNEIGLLADDSIDIKISGSVSKTLTFENNKYSQPANIFTADANSYQVSFALSDKNYKLHDSSIKTLSWTIAQYVVKVGAFSLGSGKIYDGTAVTPTITITGIQGSNGTYTYENDTFTLTYSIEKDGGSAYESGKLVNAGTYRIKVGGANGKIVAKRAKGAHDLNSDTSASYKFDSTNSTTEYKIDPCPISIEWNYPSLVYNGKNQTLTIKSISVHGVSSPITMTSNTVRSGLGNDTLTFTLSGGGVNAGSYTTKAELSSVSGTNEGVDSVVGNYTPKLFTSDPFTIVKSKVGIRYNGGTANKVYDANENVKDNNFTFAVYSTNFGASGNDDLFSIKMLYDNKNISNGYTKTINFAYTFKATNTNYELDASTATSQAVPNVGQITPAHIRVALDKLRSGKATRTFTNDPYYGGADGATGNGRSDTYRTGEGFTVSGVHGSDNIKVVAKYQEADNTRDGSGTYFNFSKYVNDIYKEGDVFKKASAGTYFKKLVFTMTGTDAANYTFNVYDSSAEGGNKYSESDSTAAAIQSVTVYDSRDSKNNKNASGAASIQIEITVKSVRVEYSDTAQSYANDDNTYNTDWKPITGTNKDMDKADAKIKVSNGWMYADGKDHTAEEGYTKREYRGYTTIRGSQNSERLGAKVDPTNGMDLNYRLSNQPTLTIAYFVADGGEYKIDSLARLLIASFYYTAHQSPGDLEIVKIVSSGYQWVTVVSNDKYEKGEEIPAGFETWDAYFAKLKNDGYEVFLNVEEIKDGDVTIPANTWGYYQSTSNTDAALPTSYKLTKDISGKFTQSDIAILNTFFTVTTVGDDGHITQTEYTWSGTNSDYLKNVLSAAVDKVATINGSLFVSQKAEGATAITGFDGTFDGNGYVIEYLNIMGYGKDNVGLFDVIGANGIVKNLHLRNVTINGNAKYVGGIAGKVLAAADALTEKSVKNVSFHGSINVTGSTDQSVGGLFGISERAVENAIVLGSITVSNVNAKVGGVVGSSEQGMSNVVSLMQIDANCNVGAFSQTNTNVTNSYHLQNAVWRRNGRSITFVKHANAKTYDELMLGSNSLYSNGTSASVLGTYDVIDETFADSGQNANPRQSKRLRDMVSVYLLMYSLSVNNGKYTISSSSWLVGTADGTTAKPIAIANKQNVSLLRELRFASFTLKANVSIEIASTFSGAFYGSVNAGAYKITCDKAMFEAYTNNASAWLSVQQ